MKGKKQKEPVGFNPAEIFAALALLEKERGIPQSFMMEKIVQALTTAYKRDHADVENVIVDVDEEHQNLKMFVQKNVVEEEDYVDPANEMPIEEAKKLSAKYEVGDIVNIPVDTVEFGRIAAGNGKQVIIQGLREAERGMVYDEFNSKQHEILTGVVTRIDPRNGNVSLRIGTGTDSTEALLMAGEQVPGEELTEGMHVKVYVVEVRRSTRGPQVLISRTHPGLVKRLFELEVPEIYDGTVEVKSIAREAGSRTKMAVWSNDENVDPIGGLRGPQGPAGRQHRGGAAGREDRHREVQRGPCPVHRRRPGACRRHRRVDGGRGQGLPRHRAGRPAVPGHRQGGPERPPGGPAHRLQDRHQARELSRRGRARRGCRAGHCG